MPESRDTICITCGQVLGDVPRLHRLADGAPCPACRDRLLETLPPILPGRSPDVEPVDRFQGELAYDEAGHDEAPGRQGRAAVDE